MNEQPCSRDAGRSCACGSPPGPGRTRGNVDVPWAEGLVSTPIGAVLRARTRLTARDRLGTIRARCAIGRMSYRVLPGLYAVGDPGFESPVFVSANYKMSFDGLRSMLTGRDAWILVLDTKGVNVWCAAGKGTFGTDEIVKRVEDSGLRQVVSHRTLVVPQLGAPGVSAPDVKERCGFRVEYGPVRVEDLPAFLDAGMKAQPEMRRVRFGLRDRTVLIPAEVALGCRHALLVATVFLLLGGLSSHGYSLTGVRLTGLPGAALTLGAFLAGAVLGPVLLPWLPGRAFAAKGAALGLALVGLLAAGGWLAGPSGSWLHAAAWVLLVPAITSFVVMNFTGASTFTSLSGVLREMRFGVPAQIASATLGVGLWIAALFTRVP